MRFQQWTVLCLLRAIERLDKNPSPRDSDRSKEETRLRRKYLVRKPKIPRKREESVSFFLKILDLLLKVVSLIVQFSSKTCTQNRAGDSAREKHTHLAAAESGQLSYDNS
jgi:hypothetical protein